MRRVTLLVTIVLVVFCTLALFWPWSTAVQIPTGASHDMSGASAVDLPVTAAGDPAVGAARPQGSLSQQRRAVEQRGVMPAPVENVVAVLPLRFVDDRGLAVGNVEVKAWAFDDALEELPAGQDGRPPAGVDSARSTEDGRLDLSIGEHAMRIAARAGGWRVATSVTKSMPRAGDGPFRGEVVLRMQRERELRFRAITAGRVPIAGVGVLCGVATNDGAFPRNSVTIVTDEQGCGTWRFVERVLYGDPTKAELHLAVATVGARRAPVIVRANALPDAVVDVVAPDFGSMLVELQWQDGRPIRAAGRHPLHVVVRSADDLELAGMSGFWRGDTFAPNEHGLVRIQHVVCGHEMSLHAAGCEPERVAGPALPGDVVRVVMRRSEPGYLVGGRVLDTGGTPLQTMLTIDAIGAMASAVSDDEGGFSAILSGDVGGRSTVFVAEGEADGELTENEVALALPAPLRPGSNEVGDVVLRRAPLLCAGRCITRDGAPLAGIALAFAHRGGNWSRTITSDDGGRFVVRAVARPGRYGVTVVGNLLMGPLEFAPGVTDLEVVVSMQGSVRATFVADESLRILECNLSPVGHTGTEVSSTGSQKIERFLGVPTVEWTKLRPGPYRFRVGIPGCRALVDELVQVAPAGTGVSEQDPRLIDIDLRGLLRAIRLDLVDPAGQPLLEHYAVAVRSENGWREIWTGRAPVQLMLSEPSDMRISVSGWRPVERTQLYSDARIEMTRSPDVTLVWPELPQLPADVTAQVAIYSSEALSLRMNHIGGLDWREGVAQWRAARIAEPKLWLWREGVDAQVVYLSPRTLDPVTLRDGQRIALRCDPADVERALRALGR